MVLRVAQSATEKHQETNEISISFNDTACMPQYLSNSFKPASPNHSHANYPRLRDCEPRRKQQARSPATARISAKINCMTSNPSEIRERAFLEPRPHLSWCACILIPPHTVTVSGTHLLIRPRISPFVRCAPPMLIMSFAEFLRSSYGANPCPTARQNA